MTTMEKNTKYGLRLPAHLSEGFRLHAARNHHTPAQLIRKFMEEYIAEEEAKLAKASQKDLFSPPKG